MHAELQVNKRKGQSKRQRTGHTTQRLLMYSASKYICMYVQCPCSQRYGQRSRCGSDDRRLLQREVSSLNTASGPSWLSISWTSRYYPGDEKLQWNSTIYVHTYICMYVLPSLQLFWKKAVVIVAQAQRIRRSQALRNAVCSAREWQHNTAIS
jgi:hypothetical protein